MVAIPTWLIGKHATAITVTAQSVAADGTLSDNTNYQNKSLVGFLDQIELTEENDQEMIQALDQRRNNNVIIGSGTSFTFTEILKTNDSAGTPTNILAALGNGATGFSGGCDYVKVALTRGGRAWAFYGVIQSYNETIVRGKSVARMVITMVDPGSANPTLT